MLTLIFPTFFITYRHSRSFTCSSGSPPVNLQAENSSIFFATPWTNTSLIFNIWNSVQVSLFHGKPYLEYSPPHIGDP